jgi:hypothetical protein
VRESAFEIRLCAHLETGAATPGDGAGVLARQVGASVGPGRRIVDVLHVEPGPGFDDRAAITPAAIPPAAVESDVSTAEWRPVTAVLPGPPERARGIAEAAADAGFFEYARRDGRDVVRRAADYPADWFGGLLGVENKPDLGDPGDLDLQLRKDVSLAALDRVVLATESYVTRAHLNRLPDPVGVWRVDVDDPEPVEVVREPEPLPTGERGVQVVERHPGRTDIEPVTAAAKRRERRRMAERAYGKGWRPAFPDCAQVERGDAAGTTVPYCPWKGRVVDPGTDCGPDCAGHDLEEPPAVDREAARDRRTAWVADPEGRARRQAGLDRFYRS